MAGQSISKQAGVVRVQLHGELTIYQAQQQYAELLELLAQHPILQLDLSQISDIDSSGVQILLQLVREAKKEAKQLSLVHATPVLIDVVSLLGLQHEIELGEQP